MMLSVEKRFGATHVYAGALVRVAHDHQVSRVGAEAAHHTHLGDAKWVTAKVGDMACEIRRVKKQSLVGYLYVDGAAASMVRYEDQSPTQAHWFDSAPLVLQKHTMGVDNLPNPIVAASHVSSMKCAKADILAFELCLGLPHREKEPVPYLEEAASFVSDFLNRDPSWIPKDELETTYRARASVIGVIRISSRKSAAAMAFWSVPTSNTEIPVATPFTAYLLHRSPSAQPMAVLDQMMPPAELLAQMKIDLASASEAG